ncbi:unnamed protein product [Anisakis simplex]|uniref:Activin_recp domain-containing protein n=1 Tax=Anisakis simplex TaxID=6269 RepID=A0A158PNM7_ANISI|nr:unnamed protein product [Anisakis simplex]
MSIAFAYTCASNQFIDMDEEDCGPTGYCYLVHRGGKVEERGCDHAFICEMLIEQGSLEKDGCSADDDIPYGSKQHGKVCCCTGIDYCNRSLSEIGTAQKHRRKRATDL